MLEKGIPVLVGDVIQKGKKIDDSGCPETRDDSERKARFRSKETNTARYQKTEPVKPEQNPKLHQRMIQIMCIRRILYCHSRRTSHNIRLSTLEKDCKKKRKTS